MKKSSKKLQNLQQVNGKDNIDVKAAPKSMNEIWGIKTNQFKDQDEESLKKRLKTMNIADLQKECIQKGVIPHDSRNKMEEKLVKAYQSEKVYDKMRSEAKVVTIKKTENLNKVLNKMKM
jgi:Mg2+/Co2+ transporter CorC